MDKENILAVNVPNAVSILVMAIAGGFLLAIARKVVKSKIGGGTPLAASDGPAPAGLSVVG